ncbi:MAG: aminopeptidase P family protein [Bdellovibrionales bacterium]|nr:aminopeptidase P family protein [Bdellovibrionales bacterium]
MRTPNIDIEEIKRRREKLAKHIAVYALVLAAAPVEVRNNDVHHPYRADSNMFYMTGFEEPDSCFIFRPGQTPETVMFVRPKDELRETWEGFRYGIEQTPKLFSIDAVYDIAEFEAKAPELLNSCENIYYSLNKNHQFDPKMMQALEKTRALRGRTGRGMPGVADSYPLLGELRLIKSEYEIEQQTKACKISAEAHVAMMKAARPGMNERELHGLFIYEIMKQGAAREGYGSIMATGDNATTLHYTFNDCEIKDGDLILIDAGAEYNFYTGDITRTFPANGKFSDVQKDLYERVLKLQNQIIESVKPGVTFKQLNDMAIEGLVDIMLHYGLLKAPPQEIIKEGHYKKYYPHGIGHWLGIDVHDAGKTIVQGLPRAFEPGMIFTIEPGIYIPEKDESAPAALRGIGIRIEDNILVTENGHKNLTEGVPKEVAEIEELMNS